MTTLTQLLAAANLAILPAQDFLFIHLSPAQLIEANAIVAIFLSHFCAKLALVLNFLYEAAAKVKQNMVYTRDDHMML